MRELKITRRKFVAMSAVALAVPTSYWMWFRGGEKLRALRDLPGQFNHFPTVCSVGIAYLMKFPEEKDAAKLNALLAAAVAATAARTTGHEPILSQKISDDFASGEVVSIDGWVLSRTECRAFALYALGQNACNDDVGNETMRLFFADLEYKMRRKIRALQYENKIIARIQKFLGNTTD